MRVRFIIWGLLLIIGLSIKPSILPVAAQDSCFEVSNVAELEDAIDNYTCSTIYLAAGTYSLTGQIELPRSLVLRGQGVDETIIERDAGVASNIYFPLFSLIASVGLEIHNMTLRNALSLGGGAIYSFNALAIGVYDSKLENNTSQLFGGAIYANRVLLIPTLAVHLERSIVVGNESYIGGGVYVDGVYGETEALGIQFSANCTLFMNNNANFTGGAVVLTGAANTGGIHNSSFITNDGGPSNNAVRDIDNFLLSDTFDATGNYWSPNIDNSPTSPPTSDPNVSDNVMN